MLTPIAVLLAVELVDELAFGMNQAAWPVIRRDLGLDYASIGIALAVATLVAGLVEPLIALAATGSRRARIIRMGGIGFAVAAGLLAAAPNLATLVIALAVLYPASGAFVGLSQAVLMDAAPERRDQSMARWVLAGSVGVTVGPAAVAAALRIGAGWRPLFAACALAAVGLALLAGRADAGPGPASAPLREAARAAAAALRRRGVLRWLALIEVADLLGDVFAGFIALYFVDAAGTGIAAAALAVLVWSIAGLAGDALLVPALERAAGTALLRVTAAVALLVLPAFLLVPGVAAKLALVAALGLLRSGWYAVPQARLYAELPDASHVAVAVSSLSTMAAAALPLVIGLAAAHAGIGRALWICLAAPVALLVALPRRAEASITVASS